MSYQDIFRESNEKAKERYALVMERIRQIGSEETVSEPYREFFRETAAFLCLTDDVLRQEETGALNRLSSDACERLNQKLYEAVLPSHYDASYANPAAAVRRLGETFGGLLCFLYAELRALIAYAFEGRKGGMTIFCELFVEIYNCFEQEEAPQKKEIEHILYWFFHDYSEVFSEDKVRDMVDPSYDFFTKIVMESDLFDLRYLYRYGEYIGDNEKKTAAFLNALSESEIQSMADTMTEGFRRGYACIGKELSKKKSVCLEYPIGFERVARAVVFNFQKLGLQTTIFRSPRTFEGRKRGCYGTSANRQYAFDHREDRCVYLDKAYVERHLETMKLAYETYKAQAALHAGPAVIEVFGEEAFAPVQTPEALRHDEKQNALFVYQRNCLGQITNAYIPGDERSFTIIAYPLPSIGPDYEAIFRETVRINALDSMRYRTMQQSMIDAMDTAEKVHVTGKGENRTDLWIRVHPLLHPACETAFENCVADVNIPVGEVFTTPVLEGTCGKLHVKRACLNGMRYRDLELDFTDGWITAYTCRNFPSEEENQRFLFEHLMQRHETLPMGEFAIGTNTTAYRMAKTYGIADKLPILIAEKTGPHFAVGDTCYSHAEDTKVCNPDGKEVVARDNAVSILRKEDGAKAYFHCHTDITIPYDELDAIVAVFADGSQTEIIRDGKFALAGTEELNGPLREG